MTATLLALPPLLVLAAVGGCALAAVAPRARWPLALRLGAAFGVGLVVLPSLLLALSWAGFVPRAWVGFALLVPLAFAAVRGRRAAAGARAAGEDPERAPLGGIEWALVGLLLALLAAPVAVALLQPIVEWDVVAIWGIKGRLLLTAPLAAGSFLHDPSLAYAHLDYPLLWPFALAWMWRFVGAADLQAVDALGVAVLAATLLVVYGALARPGERRFALAAVAALAATPMVAARGPSLLADGPLALFALALAVGSTGYWQRGDAAHLALAGCALAGLVMTKNEGTAIAAGFLAVTALFAVSRSRRGRAPALALGLLGPLLLLAGPWLALHATLPRLHHNTGAELAPARLAAQAGRWPEVLSRVPEYLLAWPDWLLFWPLVLLLVGLGWRAWRRRAELAALALWLLLPWPVYLAIYVGHELPPALLIEVTLSRLALQLAPAAVYLAVEMARTHGPFAVSTATAAATLPG